MSVSIEQTESGFNLKVDGFIVCRFRRFLDIPLKWRKLAGR